MFNDTSSPVALVKSRRSGKPRDMVEPGPTPDELHAIIAAAVRVPDHGKLAPWRIVTIAADQRDRLATLLTTAYKSEKPDAGRLEIEAMAAFAHQAPALLVVLSAPIAESKIPVWEQELSAGALCMNLLTAIHAHGYVGGWLTGWPAYSPDVRDAFGDATMRVAGFVFVGSPSRPLEERPRPEFASVVRDWA